MSNLAEPGYYGIIRLNYHIIKSIILKNKEN